MEIVWAETALTTFYNVIDYLFDHWSPTEIETFDLEVNALLKRIASFNQICPESKTFGYRKCVIDEHNSLVYYISNNTLYLVTFFRQ